MDERQGPSGRVLHHALRGRDQPFGAVRTGLLQHRHLADSDARDLRSGGRRFHQAADLLQGHEEFHLRQHRHHARVVHRVPDRFASLRPHHDADVQRQHQRGHVQYPAGLLFGEQPRAHHLRSEHARHLLGRLLLRLSLHYRPDDDAHLRVPSEHRLHGDGQRGGGQRGQTQHHGIQQRLHPQGYMEVWLQQLRADRGGGFHLCVLYHSAFVAERDPQRHVRFGLGNAGDD